MSKSKNVAMMALIAFIMGILLVGNAMAGEKENLKIIERNNNELWNLQKYEIADEIVAEDHVRHLPGGQDIRGREAYVENIKQNMAFKWVWILDPMIATGDYVFARASGNGIDPATAKPVKLTALLMFRLKDGKMVEDTLELDMLSFFQQLGYKLVPPSEK
jgi:hypothetical protein